MSGKHDKGTEILQPPGWPRPKGYANGIATEGRLVFVGGQIGWDHECKFTTQEFAGQVRQALQNVVAVLAEAGATPEHIVRMTWYVTSKRDYVSSYKAIGVAYREVIGRHYPAMSAIEVSALIEDDAKIEIEATAVIPRNMQSQRES